MNFISKFTLGISSYGKAISFVKTHRLWKFLIIPAIINLLLISGVGWLAIGSVGDLQDLISNKLGVGESDSWWSKAADISLQVVIYVLTAVVFVKSYKFLMLLLLSPALALLAEKTQNILCKNENSFEMKQFIKDVLRGIGIVIRNLAIELSLLVLLFFLSFIPIFAPFTSILIILVECYFIGFSMIDYRNEYLKLSASDSRKIIKKHRFFAIGNGLGMYLMLLVPLFGVLFAPQLAVVAGGLGIYKLEDKLE
ncbi:MAG: CysZ protein [Bacteroidia bacterium]|jgi:CysZ protein